MSNRHISGYLNWYLSSSCTDPGFAVLLKGEWGSGKTHYAKQFMSHFNLETERLTGSKTDAFVYVSLYGLCKTTDIDDQIFQQMHPLLASKGVAIAGKIARGLLKFGLKINLDNDGNATASASGSLPDVSLKSLVSNFEGKILVFDDLERCSMPLENVLGYINSFVEHHGTKVIVLGNDDEIELTLHPDQKMADSKYHKVKEKVIGKTFTVDANTEEVIDAMIESCTRDSRAFMTGVKGLCVEIVSIVEKHTSKKNFRAFGHVLRDIECLWPKIHNRYREHELLMQDFVNIFIRFDYEMQLNLIAGQDIKAIEDWHIGKLLQNGRGRSENDTKPTGTNDDRLGSFFSRHAPINEYNILMMTYELWYKVVCCTEDVADELNEAFGNTNHFIDERTPSWQRLWHHMDRKDDEIEPLMQDIAANLASHEYTQPQVVLHVFGLLFFLKGLGFALPIELDRKTRDLSTVARGYIDWLKSNNAMPEDSNVTSSLDIGSGAFGLGYAGSDSADFVSFRDYYSHSMKVAQRESAISGASSLLDKLKGNPRDFYHLIGNPNFSGSKYWDVAILNELDPATFLDVFMELPSHSKSLALEAFTERYKWLNNSDEYRKRQMRELCKELAFWQELNSAILPRMSAKPVSPSTLWATRFHESVIKNAMKSLEEFANYFQPEQG